MAATLRDRIDADPDWERLAPVPFSTVCFRYRPAVLGDRCGEPEIGRRLDAWNEEILSRVNASGRIYLSHTRLGGRFSLRVTLGNLRARTEHVERCWNLLEAAAGGLDIEGKTL
jgi:aromatic-L-amino-acid decarboxylase